MSEPALWQLAYEGKGKELYSLIETDPSRLNVVDQNGRTALHWAACGGHLELLKTLLSKGLDKDAKDRSDWSPLMLAVSAGRTDVVEYLVEQAKADVNAVNSTGQTPLHYAASKNRAQIAELLIEAGAKTDVRDWSGNTPLHRAISLGFLDVAKIILEHSPSSLVNIADNEGSTALHYACEEGNISAINLLMEYDASTSRQNKDGKTPIDVAPPALQTKLRRNL